MAARLVPFADSEILYPLYSLCLSLAEACKYRQPVDMFSSDIRYAFRFPGRPAGVYGHRHPDAGARDRREYLHFQHPGRDAAAAAALWPSLIGWWGFTNPIKGALAAMAWLRFWIGREQNTVFEDIALTEFRRLRITDEKPTGSDAPERILGASVTTAFFPLLGVHPLLGRVFLADEDYPGKDTEIVLSHGFWQRRFGSRRDAIGRS